MFSFKEPLSGRPNNYRLSEIALKSGFKFRDLENRKLDWKALGCVDVNKVIENQDYEFLEKITPKIIEAPMQSILGTSAIDPAVSSLFRLAQMSLQYMSFCHQFMSHTLYDLRRAYNYIQKKYTNLEENYKCLEEQHYKAQERVQSLLKELSGQEDAKGPSSLYPCDQCTKNFLTLDSLKSHQQRKHTVIEEKHELSDDNEKDNNVVEKDLSPKVSPHKVDSLTPNGVENRQNEIADSNSNKNNNNNNNDNEPNANCLICSEKLKTNSSSVATQCEVNTFSNENAETQKTQKSEDDIVKTAEVILKNENDSKGETNENVVNPDKNVDRELIQNAYETISELKKEIIELKNSLEAKTSPESQQIESEPSAAADKPGNLTSLTQTNDKIDVIEQKFNAFEVMYTESQHQFIESFRNLDERQKIYMDNIQVTIKEIVEKSLGQHELGKNDATSTDAINQITSIDQNHAEIVTESTETKKDSNIDCTDKQTDVEPPKKYEDKPLLETNVKQQQSVVPQVAYDSSSYSDDDAKQLTCEVEVHAVSQNERHETDQEDKNTTKKHIKKLKKPIKKDVAIHKFEDRLRQFGVDVDSTGLATPRSCEINQDLADERKEMKKAHKTFDKTRKQLRNEVDRLAKGKLRSANSATSLSSYQSDQTIDDSDRDEVHKTQVRPKSASVQTMRKRNAKKLMNKFVANDIDENDIIDKMQMAQKAISSHRQCIQQLLETTAHSPSSLHKIKYSSTAAAKEESKTNEGGDNNNESGANQYNKMPNVIQRRVVFVNLDEDS